MCVHVYITYTYIYIICICMGGSYCIRMEIRLTPNRKQLFISPYNKRSCWWIIFAIHKPKRHFEGHHNGGGWLDLHDKNARLINWMVPAANFDKQNLKS